MNNIGPIIENYGKSCILTYRGNNEELIFNEDILDETKDINQLWTCP